MKKQVTVKNINISYYTFGKGKPLLFLHGGRLRASVFKKTLAELSKNYHVIAPDIPGYGDSSSPKEFLSFRNYASLFVSFIELLKLKEIVIVGYSLGGGIAYNMAPISNKVKKLVLIDSAGIEKARNKQLKRDMERLIFYVVHPQYYWTFLTLTKEWVLFITKHLFHLIYVKKTRENLNNSCSYLKNIKTQTSIIWAKNDAIFPVMIAKKLHISIKNSKLIIVEGNHDWVLYDESRFIDVINKALI